MADEYIDVPIEFDENAIYQMGIDRVQSYWENWVPRPGSFIDILLRICASMAAIGAEVQSTVPSDIFEAFGTLANEPPIEGTPASATTTWTMQDNAGYDIPANTPVGLTTASTADPVAFWTLDDVTVPPGSTTATITIVAVEPGAEGSNLDTVVRVDSLGYVLSIALVAASSGGEDPELPDAYVDRLSQVLETRTDTPILGRDFAILARETLGVYRCAYLDNYNPADGTFTNDKMVALCPIDVNGLAVSSAIQTAVQQYMQNLREVNFVCNVVSPQVSIIDVAYTAHVQDASNEATAQAAINAALADFFNPANWGIPDPPSGESPIWTNTPTIRLNKVIQKIEDVPGVDWAAPVTMAIHPAVLAAADILMPGAFPLPQLGTITPTMVTG